MITVIIERHIAPDMSSTYENFANKIIQATVSARGFISGESLCGVDDPNARYIIVKMKSKEDWQHWLRSKQRRELVTLVSPLLTIPEKVTLLTH
ncbi:MAG: antibiotic biosynthesis monooxygenase [Gammaproteobacteria bacterium]|nr:MAG: antibiotic biosynthesis monooxygenase [Gammaproteobacteria bacterium]RLA53380.1 MAG: antibiotic biosynthesis monooxygenase [Gammaproteobacteria bacterium]